MERSRYCLALDLKEDPELIEAYERFHQPGHIWPEVKASIKEAGIYQMEIYRVGNRMFMIMEVGPDFDFERKAEMDAKNPKVQEWEKLMWKFQQALPWAQPGEKWVKMEKIFSLAPRG